MVLRLDGISKTYGSIQALDQVSATCRAGTIHAIVGENGAGKSTLMQVVGGFAVPDEGRVDLEGNALPFGDPIRCRRAGIRMVHQHFMLVPSFTVWENLRLGFLDSDSPDAAAEAALKAAAELGWTFERHATTASLPVGVQQRLEILKAIALESSVTILDEPTAVLTREEVSDLFVVLRRLRDKGRLILLIAHKVSEIREIADHVTVLRRGRVTLDGEMPQTSDEALVQAMVGEIPPELSVTHPVSASTVLELRGVSALGALGQRALDGIDLTIRQGEIVGIGGVDGNGQLELAEVIAGLRPLVSGSIRRPDRVAYIPQDRQRDGLALSLSVSENLLLGALDRPDLFAGPWLKTLAAKRWVSGVIARYDIKLETPQSLAGSLSGGNQQKVVAARAMDRHPELIVAANPTRGLDVQASRFVHQVMTEAASNGTAIVLISTDLDELALLAHRTLFLSRGKLSNEGSAKALVGGES